MKHAASEYAWVTRVEAIVMFHGHVWEEGKRHAEKLLALAETSKPNQMAPKDKELRLFKILKSVVEGEARKQTVRQELSITGDVNDTDAARKIMVAMGGKPIKNAAAEGEDDDDEGNGDEKP